MTSGDDAGAAAGVPGNHFSTVRVSEAERTSRDMVMEVPTLGRLAELDTRLLFKMDSANMQPADWLTLAREVHRELPNYDGIVVIHGTDTMAHTASAPARSCSARCRSRSCSRAAEAARRVSTDARAESRRRGACGDRRSCPRSRSCFHSRALRGARVRRRRTHWASTAFDSPQLRAARGARPRRRSGIRTFGRRPISGAFDDRLEPRVLAGPRGPWARPAPRARRDSRRGEGLVLEGYGTGNVPLTLPAGARGSEGA